MRTANRIGDGHRRAPGDVVTGRIPLTDNEIIGRVIVARLDGSCVVRTDDGTRIDYTAPHAATMLRTIEECDAGRVRTSWASGAATLIETAVQP